MKKYRAICVGAILALCGITAEVQHANAAEQQPEALLRFHFAGTGRIAAAPMADTLRTLAALPETKAFAAMVLDRLVAPLSNNVATAQSPELARPLVEDLVKSEWFVEVRETGAAQPAWAIAVKVGETRTAAWSGNLWKLAPQILPKVAVPKEAPTQPNWSAEAGNPQFIFQFRTAGDWIVLGRGLKSAPLTEELASRVKSAGAPLPSDDAKVLELSLDLPRIAERHHPGKAASLPQVLLSARLADDLVMSEATLTFAHPVNLKLDPWQIPTNTIRDPLIEFAAVRGIAPLVPKAAALQQYLPQPAPNQLFEWTRMEVPYLVSVAVPAPNATEQVDRIGQHVLALLEEKVKHPSYGKFEYVTNKHSLQWRNLLPLIIPFVRPAVEPGDDFIYAGLFPIDLTAKSEPAPVELLKQVTQAKGLIFYHWEVMPPRLRYMQTVFRILSLISKESALTAPEIGPKWVVAAAPHLGNSVTEVTQDSPNTLKLVRRSHLGLNSLELMTLVHWVGTSRFPDKAPTLPFLPLLTPPGQEGPAAAPAAPVPPGK